MRHDDRNEKQNTNKLKPRPKNANTEQRKWNRYPKSRTKHKGITTIIGTKASNYNLKLRIVNEQAEFLLGSFLWRLSRLAQLGGNYTEDPELASRNIYLLWTRSILGFPWRTWNILFGRKTTEYAA